MIETYKMWVLSALFLFETGSFCVALAILEYTL